MLRSGMSLQDSITTHPKWFLFLSYANRHEYFKMQANGPKDHNVRRTVPIPRYNPGL
jgi:hypothetical protein